MGQGKQTVLFSLFLSFSFSLSLSLSPFSHPRLSWRNRDVLEHALCISFAKGAVQRLCRSSALAFPSLLFFLAVLFISTRRSTFCAKEEPSLLCRSRCSDTRTCSDPRLSLLSSFSLALSNLSPLSLSLFSSLSLSLPHCSPKPFAVPGVTEAVLLHTAFHLQAFHLQEWRCPQPATHPLTSLSLSLFLV